MARNLNKSRIRDSKIALIAAFLVVVFTKAFIDSETPMHEMVEFTGYFLIALCAMGRLYSTAFLGGHKNETLITYGPFSVTRNPLYFFSLLGLTGVALLSVHLLIIVLLPLFFIVAYHFLIKREGEFLLGKFGDEYRAYMASTPRLFPNFKRYHAPDIIQTVPRYLNKAFRDAIWWFLAFPVFEGIEYLQEAGLIKPLFLLP
ncbi:MAG: isoprenylcysteine carboxylmethyltransferase family protein [Alphaproteobacteria bacterium]|nr:isoprenylcysteine carboxylmethyltransferase family protein [Alphaproteobacteria bacterium]